MVDYREIIRLKSAGYSNSSVASSTGSGRNKVAEVWKRAGEKNISWPIPGSLTNEDLKLALYPELKDSSLRMLPDYEHIHEELAKPGVTLTLLWSEYCLACEQAGKIPYQHTQFNEHYHMFAATHKATLRLKHKPGEQMRVDWVGDTLSISDPVTGGTMKAYVFVACLPCSTYGYAEAFPDMKTLSWLAGHIHAFEFFGGVPMLEPGENDHSGGCFKRALAFITKSISTVQLPFSTWCIEIFVTLALLTEIYQGKNLGFSTKTT